MVNDGKIFSKFKSLKFLDEVFKLLVMKRLLIMTFMSGCQPPEVDGDDGDDGDDSVGDGNYNDDGDDDTFARLLVPWISFGYMDTLLYSGYLLDTWIPFCTLDIFCQVACTLDILERPQPPCLTNGRLLCSQQGSSF